MLVPNYILSGMILQVGVLFRTFLENAKQHMFDYETTIGIQHINEPSISGFMGDLISGLVHHKPSNFCAFYLFIRLGALRLHGNWSCVSPKWLDFLAHFGTTECRGFIILWVTHGLIARGSSW